MALINNSFLRGVFQLLAGTGLAQLLTIIFAPVLTRLYDPEAYGMAATITAVVAVFTIISTLKLEMAIPVAESEGDVSALLLLSIGFLILSSSIISLGFFIYYLLFLHSLLNLTILKFFSVALCFFFTKSIVTIMEHLLIRDNQFKTLSKSRILLVVTAIVIQLYFSSYREFGLLLGLLVGDIVSIVFIFYSFHFSKYIKPINISLLKTVIKKYFKYPKFMILDGFLNQASMQMLPPFLSIAFGPTIAGQNSLAYRVLSLPSSLIAKSISQVYFGHVKELMAEQKVIPLITKYVVLTSSLGIPALFLFWVKAPSIFEFVFGSDWKQSGEIARLISPWILMVLICSPLTVTLIARNRQEIALKFNIILFFGRMSVFVIAFSLFDWYEFFVLFAGVSFITWFCFLYIVMCFILNVATTSYIFPIIKVLITCCIILFFYYFFGAIDQTIPDAIYWVSMAVYSVYAWIVLTKFKGELVVDQ